ncbi:MAG: choice-of-anchor D domain-containing protein [Elusimicrobiales bacterium]
MNGGNPLNWKRALMPAAAFTLALAAGINYFVGGRGDGAAPAGNDASFKFASGPKYAPGSAPARGQAANQGSSIDLFREVNKNYASAEPGEEAGIRPVKKPRSKAELQEFMSQVRNDINFDPAAESPGEGDGPSAQNRASGGSAGAPAREQQAAAVTARTAAVSGDRAPKLNASRSGFSAGRMTGGLSRSGGALQRRGPGAEYGASSGGGTNQDTDYSDSSGGGARSLEAGAYGSHGGGRSAAQPSASGDDASSAGGAPKEAKEPPPPPAPVAFVWPRSFDFGNMYMYETASRLVVVMNIGNAPLKVGTIENLDPETPFLKEKDKCSKTTLAPGKSCTFKVRFSPREKREYLTGFGIPSNDEGAMDYQSYIEVKGNSKYSYSTWWWRRFNYSAALNNRVNFGMVPAGQTTDEALRVTNNSGGTWENLKLNTSGLPSSFKITRDGCSGRDLGPHQSCAVTVAFTPTDAVNRKFTSRYYGQYHAAEFRSGAKQYHPRPSFPPLVLEKPVEADPKGTIRVLANYNRILKTGHAVLDIPVQGKSCAAFPLMGLVRLHHYYYFKK